MSCELCKSIFVWCHFIWAMFDHFIAWKYRIYSNKRRGAHSFQSISHKQIASHKKNRNMFQCLCHFVIACGRRDIWSSDVNQGMNFLCPESSATELSFWINYWNKRCIGRWISRNTAVQFFYFSFPTDCCAAGSAQGTNKQTSKRGHYCGLDNIPFFKSIILHGQLNPEGPTPSGKVEWAGSAVPHDL